MADDERCDNRRNVMNTDRGIGHRDDACCRGKTRHLSSTTPPPENGQSYYFHLDHLKWSLHQRHRQRTPVRGGVPLAQTRRQKLLLSLLATCQAGVFRGHALHRRHEGPGLPFPSSDLTSIYSSFQVRSTPILYWNTLTKFTREEEELWTYGLKGKSHCEMFHNQASLQYYQELQIFSTYREKAFIFFTHTCCHHLKKALYALYTITQESTINCTHG